MAQRSPPMRFPYIRMHGIVDVVPRRLSRVAVQATPTPTSTASASIERERPIDRPIDIVQRWQDFGGTWRVEVRTTGSVTICLSRCDGGEDVERLTSSDPDLITWLAGRTSSAQE